MLSSLYLSLPVLSKIYFSFVDPCTFSSPACCTPIPHPATPPLPIRYRMDYMKFVDYHRSESADITVACIPNSKERAKDFGLMKIDSKKRIVVRGGVMGEGQRGGRRREGV